MYVCMYVCMYVRQSGDMYTELNLEYVNFIVI
jgi:hypothetical protein